MGRVGGAGGSARGATGRAIAGQNGLVRISEVTWRPNPADTATSPTISHIPGTDQDRVRREIWIVLGLSLGASAIYSIVSIINRLTAEAPLGEQSTAINESLSERSYFDLTYQVLGNFFAIVPVILALFLLSGRWYSQEPAVPGTRRVGFDLTRPGRDLAWGFGLAAMIGVPGLAFYLFGRAVGITVSVNPAALNPEWWAIPVLIIAAFKNAIVEEVLVVGYLAERTRQLGWTWWRFSLSSAVLRGTYHLYQGIGPFIGNIVMGLFFNEFYRRRGRTMPLVVAHALIDIVAFVGWWIVPQAVRDALS